MKTYKQVNKELCARIEALQNKINSLLEYKFVVESENLFDPIQYHLTVEKLYTARQALNCVAIFERTDRMKRSDKLDNKSHVEIIATEALHQTELEYGIQFKKM